MFCNNHSKNHCFSNKMINCTTTIRNRSWFRSKEKNEERKSRPGKSRNFFALLPRRSLRPPSDSLFLSSVNAIYQIKEARRLLCTSRLPTRGNKKRKGGTTSMDKKERFFWGERQREIWTFLLCWFTKEKKEAFFRIHSIFVSSWEERDRSMSCDLFPLIRGLWRCWRTSYI